MTKGSVGVLGAGQMGGGIAQVIAQAGLPVIITDEVPDRAKKAVVEIEERLMRRVKDGRLEQVEVERIVKGITPVNSYEDFAPCELIIEAVYENPSVKAEVLESIEKHINLSLIHI